MIDGKGLRDAGMASAEAAEDAIDPGWSRRAYDAIESVALTQLTVHVDDVLEVFGERPRHPNAWGAVWMRAIRTGVIERSESWRPSKDRCKHAHNYPVYISLVY